MRGGDHLLKRVRALGVSTCPAAPTGGWLFELGSGLAESS